MNHTSAYIYVEVFRQEILRLIEWGPCEHPDDCPARKVAPGQTLRLGLEAMMEQETETLTVFWWRLTETTDGTRYQVTDLTIVDVSVR